MRSRRVEYGSFRERLDELVPMLGLDPSPMGQDAEETPRAFAGPRGSAAYVINQFLYEHSRH